MDNNLENFKDIYKLGIVDIDIDIEIDRIFDIFNSCLSGGVRGILQRLNDLGYYIYDHMKKQEDLLFNSGYRDLSEHEKDHSSLLNSIITMKKNLDSGELANFENSMSTIMTQFQTHIREHDVKACEFLKGKGHR